ncbi:MAG TPA: hypothetical protein VLF41_03850 [Candidatus Nanoarchaeia archaeon]|nr:hypothetical protein [Candidatus Nanoarchaeia archaeon]
MDPNVNPNQQPAPVSPEPQKPAPAGPELPAAPAPTPTAAPASTSAVPPASAATSPPAAQTPPPAAAPLNTPAVADDVDVIEKEWVDKAQQVVADTADNPRAEEGGFENLQEDYLKKRYGKDLKKAPED